MEKIILTLRKFSLRWIMIISFVLAFIGSYLAMSNKIIVFFGALIMAGGGVLLYATVCAQAIENIKKSVTTFYILLIAGIVGILGQMNNLNHSLDFEGLMLDALFGGDAADRYIYELTMSTYKLNMCTGFIFTIVFIFSFSSVAKKYRSCWVGLIIIYGLNSFNLLLLGTTDGFFGTYQAINFLTTLISAIVLIMIFIKGNNKNLKSIES